MIISGQLRKNVTILNQHCELSEAALYLLYSLAQAVLFSPLAILFDLLKPDISVFFMITLHCYFSPGTVN